VFAKPFDDITAEDIRDLCTRGAAENQLLEYKRELPAERNRPDPWPDGGEFTKTARDRLFREIVAFANAQGGTLVLGIDETSDEPPRASAICPLPRIHDLAKRLEDAARECIDPVLPGLQIRGVETAGPDEGVVIFRTIESPVAPHRVRSEGHAYIRRGASSVPMTMQQIQDLALDRARGAERLDAIFRERAALFDDWWQGSSGEVGGYRITAVPFGGFPGIPRLSSIPHEFGNKRVFLVSWAGRRVQFIGPAFDSFRQIVRGQRSYKRDNSARIDVYETGIIDLWHRERTRDELHLAVGWLLGSYLCVLDAIDKLRELGKVPEWEFVIEFFLDGSQTSPQGLTGPRDRLPSLAVGTFFDAFGPSRIDELPVKFPHIPYRNQNDREAILHMVLGDLMGAAGRPLQSEPVIKLLE
jgi:Putative DNA-binding domain